MLNALDDSGNTHAPKIESDSEAQIFRSTDAL